MATYTLISSNVLSSSAASVTFSAIPATYTDLVLRISARSDNANFFGNIVYKVNGVSTAYNSATDLYGYTSSAAYSTRQSNQAFGGRTIAISGSTATSSTFGSTEIYIPTYTSTTSKPISVVSMSENNSTSVVTEVEADLISNSVAIVSIVFTEQSGANFVSGSSFYLYGISNA
jgi:hypothetical protein